MGLNGRQLDILDFLKRNRHATVDKIAKTFYVSPMTVRRDLSVLENAKCVKRYNGGAMFIQNVNKLPVDCRTFERSDEKKALCRIAAKHVKNGMTIFIDSSSTCTFLPQFLSDFEGISIITNSIIVPTLTDVPCTVIGGNFLSSDMCLVGPTAVASVKNLHADAGFYSAMGIKNGIITDANEDQSVIRREIIGNCDKNFFLLTEDKFGKTFTYKISDENRSTIIRIGEQS